MPLKDQRAAMHTQTTTSGNLAGRLQFPTYLVTTSSPVPDGDYSAEIRLDPKQFGARAHPYRPDVTRDAMPTYPVGSLVIVADQQRCTGAGLILREIADEVAPSFEIYVMPMTAPVRLRHSARYSATGQASMAYRFFEDPAFTGSVQYMAAVDAQRLRQEIGQAVDPRLLETFWSPAEREWLVQETAERERFRVALKALVGSLETADEAA